MSRSSYCSIFSSIWKLQLLVVILSFCSISCVVCGLSGNYDDSVAKHNYAVLFGVNIQSPNLKDSFSVTTSLLSIFNSPARIPRASTIDVTQGNGSNSNNDNCTDPHDKGSYESTCQFVKAECGKKSELIDYLAFVLCDLPYIEVRLSSNTPMQS